MRRQSIVSLGVAGAIVLLTAAPRAQQPSTPVFRSGTELVLVNVVVRDRSGAVVRGLTRDDFVVTEDDRPQTITSFDFEQLDQLNADAAPRDNPQPILPPKPVARTAEAAAAAPPPKVDMHGRRLIILFFDLSSMQPEEVTRAVKAAHDYIDTKISPADLIAVASFSTSLAVAQDFTADHEELAAAIDAFGGNGADCNGHGTHVAGTIGGSTYGVAKSSMPRGVRVLDCNGSGSNSGVIAGVDWVRLNHIAPAVANMSLGGGISSALDTAVNNLHNANVTIAVAAGNSNANACNSSPARAANAITVGSTTTTDARSSFSNFGTCVDIFAPGSGILSSWFSSNTATATLSGTSMASPHVAGAAALYKQANPSASSTTIRNALVNNATTNVITNVGTGSPNRLLYTLFF